jgi:peptide subunit release factor 1 (eRF1)
MIGTERIRALGEELAMHPGPVVSLYLDVNRARPDNARKAYALRARAAMDRLGLPKRISRSLTARLKMLQGIPEARTLVVFAGTEPEGFFESYALRPELPLVEAEGGVVARCGEAYLAPLLLALREGQRYLVLLLAKDRVRLFVYHLDEAVELDAFVQPLDASGWRPLREHSTGMPGVPARGGSGKDLFEKRVADWRRRFQLEVSRRLDGVLNSLGDDVRIVLLGQAPELATFEAALPPALQALVVERRAAPSNPDAPVSELEPLLAEAVDGIEAEAGRALLDRVEQTGVRGFGPTLEALEEGRVYVLAVPWRMRRRVFRCRVSGRVAPTLADAQRLCPDDVVDDVALADALPELADRHAIRLVLVRGENEARLQAAFDGLAGLTRW